LNSFIRILVTSNGFTSINVASITLITLYVTNHPFLLSLPFTVFSGTLFIYTLNRYTDRGEDMVNSPLRFQYIDRYGKATLGSATGLYLLSLFFVLQMSWFTFLTALLPLFIAIFYSVFRLKRVFLVKNVAVSSGVLCAVMIVLVNFNDFTRFSIGLVLFFFLVILVNTIVYDIKDVEGDSRYRINTLPVRYGLKKTKMVCYLLLAGSVFCIPLLISFNPRFLPLLAFSPYLGSYIAFSGRPYHLPSWFYGIFVDGEYIFVLACCGIAVAAGIG
jgi:4-hydroxybenzoate polyprenyltransferase